MPPAVDPVKQQQRLHQLKDFILENERGCIATGNAALKSAVLLNGATAAALLAFIAHQWTPGQPMMPTVSIVVGSINQLLFGVFSAVLATGFGYLRMFFGNLHLSNEAILDGSGGKYRHLANACVLLAIALTVNAYVWFGIAVWRASNALA